VGAARVDPAPAGCTDQPTVGNLERDEGAGTRRTSSDGMRCRGSGPDHSRVKEKSTSRPVLNVPARTGSRLEGIRSVYTAKSGRRVAEDRRSPIDPGEGRGAAVSSGGSHPDSTYVESWSTEGPGRPVIEPVYGRTFRMTFTRPESETCRDAIISRSRASRPRFSIRMERIQFVNSGWTWMSVLSPNGTVRAEPWPTGVPSASSQQTGVAARIKR